MKDCCDVMVGGAFVLVAERDFWRNATPGQNRRRLCREVDGLIDLRAVCLVRAIAEDL